MAEAKSITGNLSGRATCTVRIFNVAAIAELVAVNFFSGTAHAVLILDFASTTSLSLFANTWAINAPIHGVAIIIGVICADISIGTDDVVGATAAIIGGVSVAGTASVNRIVAVANAVAVHLVKATACTRIVLHGATKTHSITVKLSG